MGNILGGIWDTVKQTAIDQPKDIIKNVGKGDLGGAFNSFKDTFGDNNRALSKNFNDFGIKGWVGDHPQESIGALIGAIYGGVAAAGAGAAGAAGGAGASAGAGVAGTGSSALGGVGASAYLAPAASGGVASTGTGASLASTGALSSVTANAPTTLSLLNMGKAGMAGAGSVSTGAGTSGAAGGAGMGTFSPTLLGKEAATSAITSAGGSAPASYSAAGKSALSNPDTWNTISRLMNSVKPGDQGQSQVGPAPMAPGHRGNFNFDRKAFQNQALTKTYSDLYNNPTRAANIKF